MAVLIVGANLQPMRKFVLLKTLARAYFVGPKNKDKEIRTKQDEICLPQKYRAVN